jgi:hypothetical protein
MPKSFIFQVVCIYVCTQGVCECVQVCVHDVCMMSVWVWV